MIIDATNLVLGRLASYAAKQSLLGEKIEIVNCDKAVITGTAENIFSKYKRNKNRGTHAKGPFVYSLPDKFVKRTIRGMLSYKQERGREALGRIRCYLDVPENFKDKKAETLQKANVSKMATLKYITVGKLCQELKQR